MNERAHELNQLKQHLSLPNVNDSYSGGYGFSMYTKDYGSIDMKYLKIKQNLSNIDMIRYCKVYMFSSMEDHNHKDIENFQYDPNQRLNLRPQYKWKNPERKTQKYCATKYKWTVLSNGEDCDMNLSEIAKKINKTTSRWIEKNKLTEEQFEKKTNEIQNILERIVLSSLIPSWKHLLVFGKNETQDLDCEGSDRGKAEAVHFWKFFDQADSDDYFTQAML